MKKIYIISLLLVILCCTTVYAGSVSYSNSAVFQNSNGSYCTISFSDIFNDGDVSDDNIKLYSYVYNHSDLGYPIFLLVSDTPFSSVCTNKVGASTYTYEYSVSKVLNNKMSCCYFTDTGISATSVINNMSALNGYYCLAIRPRDDSYSLVSYNCRGTYDNLSDISSDFFQLPPTHKQLSQVQSQGLVRVGEVLLIYLVYGVGLVIFLIALWILVSLLARYLRRSFNL